MRVYVGEGGCASSVGRAARRRRHIAVVVVVAARAVGDRKVVPLFAEDRHTAAADPGRRVHGHGQIGLWYVGCTRAGMWMFRNGIISSTDAAACVLQESRVPRAAKFKTHGFVTQAGLSPCILLRGSQSRSDVDYFAR